MNFLLNRDERVYLRVQREVTESKNSFIFLFSLKMFVTHTCTCTEFFLYGLNLSLSQKSISFTVKYTFKSQKIIVNIITSRLKAFI